MRVHADSDVDVLAEVKLLIAGVIEDLTPRTVEVAFVPRARDVLEADWQLAVWEVDAQIPSKPKYYAKITVGPTNLVLAEDRYMHMTRVSPGVVQEHGIVEVYR